MPLRPVLLPRYTQIKHQFHLKFIIFFCKMQFLKSYPFATSRRTRVWREYLVRTFSYMCTCLYGFFSGYCTIDYPVCLPSQNTSRETQVPAFAPTFAPLSGTEMKFQAELIRIQHQFIRTPSPSEANSSVGTYTSWTTTPSMIFKLHIYNIVKLNLTFRLFIQK